MTFRFYKYHGAGNDFVMMDARENPFKVTPELVQKICDRHFCIGADGFIALESDAEADFYMRYFNADGTEAMCGNGGRCAVLFAHHLGIGSQVKSFRSCDGYHDAEVVDADERAGRIRLGMIDVEGFQMKGDAIFFDTGSPHYVRFVDDVDAVDLLGTGPQIRYSEEYRATGGTNVNFAQVAGDGSLKIRTYERGVENETLACGTGATACALAANVLCFPDRTEFTVGVRGGSLTVRFEKSGKERFRNVTLEGPAVKVFECEIELSGLVG